MNHEFVVLTTAHLLLAITVIMTLFITTIFTIALTLALAGVGA